MGESVFSILNNKVKELALSRFKEPTLVQKLAIPSVIEGKNVLIIAETGSGKTESAMLGIFSKLLEKKYEPIAVLYLTPMRSLNRDLLDRLLWWCNKLEIDISVRHGDTTQYERRMQLEYPPHILISTPEQINAMLVGKRFREHLKNIRFVIIDEVHEIVSNKRGVQLTVSLERLKRLCGKPQIIALSATVGSPDEAAKFIFSNEKYEIIKAISPKNILLRVESPYPSKKDRELAEKIFIGESVVSRLRMIHELIKKHKSSLIFTNTREAAEILSSRLRLIDENLPHEVHHSSLSKEIRVKAEKDFKTEKLKAIVATSSLELGIDIGSIELVLQYMSPRQVTKIIQRVGRSGHTIGKLSKGIILASEGDDIFESAVISRKALKGEVEKLRIYENCYDILTHQLIGMAIEDYKLEPEKAYEIIKKAYPFRNLKQEEFLRIVKFLDNQLRLVFFDEKVKRRKRAFKYYFENLSVIPDQRSYKVIDTTSNTFIGNLDEEFVITHGEIGSSFIVKGNPWKIVSKSNEKIFVERINDIESAIPAWEGELIPVPFEVAQEVGILREEIGKMVKRNLKDEEMIEKIKRKYPVSTQCAKKMIQIIKKHTKKFPLPKNDNIILEKFQSYVVLHCLFGTLVNETLSKFITTILSAEYGELITSKTDPYRIILNNCKPEDVKKVLFQYKPEDVKILLEKSLPRSSLFKYRFLHVAKRFGVVSRDANFNTINVDKLIDIYWNTPVFKETLRELFKEKLDVKKTEEILRKIQNGKLEIIEVKGLSPLGKLGFRYELQDVVKPERPEKEIFKIFKRRLLNTKVRLLCINCGKHFVTKYVKDVEKEPRCKFCQSRLIAVVKPHDIEAKKIVKKWLEGKELTDEEKRKLETMKKMAELVIIYGKKAVIALAGRGIGPQNATRILSRMFKNDDEFYKSILDAEREFIRTKRYWH